MSEERDESAWEFALEAAERILEGYGGTFAWYRIDNVTEDLVKDALVYLLTTHGGQGQEEAEKQARTLLFEEKARRAEYDRYQEIGPANMVDPLRSPARPREIRAVMDADPDPRNKDRWRARMAESIDFWWRGRRS